MCSTIHTSRIQTFTSITTRSKPSVQLGRWLNDLADDQFETKHKKGRDKILADESSRLNLPNCDKEEMAYAEKIGLQYNSNVRVLEFHEMMEVIEKEKLKDCRTK